MSPNRDTRALVREVYPAILATGRNVTSMEVRAMVRTRYPNLATSGWNPSESTISSELQAIRKEHGAALMGTGVLQGLTPGISEAVVGFANRLMEISEGEVRTQLAEEFAKAESIAAEARAEASAEAQKAQQAMALLDVERSNHRIALEAAQQQIADLNQRIDSLSTQLLEQARETERAQSLANERGEALHAAKEQSAKESKQLQAQLELADTRYRDLTTSSMREVDLARQEKKAANAQLAAVRETVTELESRLHEAVKTAASAEGQNRMLREQLAAKESALSAQQTELGTLTGALSVCEQRLSEQATHIHQLEDDARQREAAFLQELEKKFCP
jgi:DNA repair exonuclease SbcCD ATPase subunit